MENRLFRRTVLTLLALLSATFAPSTARTGNDAANVASAVNDTPSTPFHGTWIDSATSLWALSPQPRFAALDASFWEYDRWKVQEERATVRLKSTNGTRRTLRLELANDSTLLWDDDGTLRTLLRESPTVAQRPFATPPDTTSFACGPWVNDSILIEGFVIDYQHGVTHFNYRFQFLFPDNNSGFELRPFPLDSLGRFRFTVPVHYEKLHLLGNYVVAGPGDHLFIAIHTRDRNLFMGDNARINQELDRYNPSQYADQFMPSPRANERISELSSWRFGQLSTLRVALRTIADFCAQHQLSRKTQQVYNSFAKYATLQKLISMPEMSGIICPYTYYLPDEHLDYSDPELLLWADNQALLMPFTRLHSRYQPINMADRLGLQGDDRITFLNFGYMYQLDPTLLNEFRAHTLPRVDSVLQTKPFDVETALQWAGPITDSLLPTPGPNRDHMFTSGFKLLWLFSEIPLSDQTLDLIRNELAGSPLLRDSLLECNTRYRRLAEQNASLSIPTWTVGDTIVQADSIVRSLLGHSTDRPTCLFILQSFNNAEQISALQKALETEPLDIIYIFQEGFPYKWRNITARYGLTAPNVHHCLLDAEQLAALTQAYRVRPDQPLLLFDRDDRRITAPGPSLSNLENVLTFIRDHTKP